MKKLKLVNKFNALQFPGHEFTKTMKSSFSRLLKMRQSVLKKYGINQELGQKPSVKYNHFNVAVKQEDNEMLIKKLTANAYSKY